MRSLPRFLSGALAATGFWFAPSLAAEPVAIVSPRSGVTALSPAQIADIYLGRAQRFPDGTPAIPCDLPEESPLRTAFYAKVVGKSPAQVKAHWSKLIFTGRGQPPREVANGEEAKKFVRDQPNAVCYVDKGEVDRTVRAVLSP